MPRRALPLNKNKMYHVYNTSINGDVFEGKDYGRALRTLAYYQFTDPGMKLSRLLKKPDDKQGEYIADISLTPKHVDLVAFCLLPDHYHLILLQNTEDGISNFISNFTNSYTRYFNNKNNNKGAIFKNPFKAVEVKDMDALVELSRHIHLEPHLKGIQDLESLSEYPYSSLWEYENPESMSLCFKKPILDEFEKRDTTYPEFVKNVEEYNKNRNSIQEILFHK